MTLARIDNDPLLNSILETAPTAIVVIDETGHVLSFSPAGETMFGWMHHEIEGQNVARLMLPSDAASHDDHIRRYVRTGEARIIGRPRAMRARHRDGHPVPVRLSVGEFRQNGVRHFVGIIEDLTQLDDVRRRLSLAERSLDRLSRLTAMGTLASVVAHDINQPLTGALGLIEAVELRLSRRLADATEEERTYLRAASDEVRRAGAIVQRARTLMERGEPDRRPVDLNGAVREACLLAAGGAPADETSLSLELAPALPPVHADRVQLQQLVVNLVRNALDAVAGQEDQRIVVSTRREADSAVLEVSDSGPGIPEDLAEEVFDAFTTTKRDGLGLGLAIARSIVEAHGGKLAVDRRPAPDAPPGARLVVSLPIAPPDAATAPAAAAAADDGASR